MMARDGPAIHHDLSHGSLNGTSIGRQVHECRGSSRSASADMLFMDDRGSQTNMPQLAFAENPTRGTILL